MEVRCCCNAGLLLGTIPDPPKKEEGTYMVPGVNGHVEVEVATLYRPFWENTLAVKSNDKPISYFEQIIGWVPAETIAARVK